MSLKDSLTTEELKSRFSNPFSLVNYAISLAKTRMNRGEVGEEENVATKVLEMIVNKQDIQSEEEIEEKEEKETA